MYIKELPGILTTPGGFICGFLIIDGIFFIDEEMDTVRTFTPPVLIKGIGVYYLTYFIGRYFVVMVYDLIEMGFPI